MHVIFDFRSRSLGPFMIAELAVHLQRLHWRDETENHLVQEVADKSVGAIRPSNQRANSPESYARCCWNRGHLPPHGVCIHWTDGVRCYLPYCQTVFIRTRMTRAGIRAPRSADRRVSFQVGGDAHGWQPWPAGPWSGAGESGALGTDHRRGDGVSLLRLTRRPVPG
jgi:hypothetical protein